MCIRDRRYTSHDSGGILQVSYERIRIVFNRDGVIRLEEVAVA